MWLVNLCLNELKRRKRMKKSEISPDEFSNVSDDDMPITGQLQNNKRYSSHSFTFYGCMTLYKCIYVYLTLNYLNWQL